MTSLITNSSAMNALSALRQVNQSLSTTQGRISSGLQITSAKDNAAYFQISETMKGDSGSISAIREGLTLTKNSVATAPRRREPQGSWRAVPRARGFRAGCHGRPRGDPD